VLTVNFAISNGSKDKNYISMLFVFPVVPEENVGTHQHGTMCVEGTMRETLLNGDHENYNMDYGYTLHMINDACSEGITSELAVHIDIFQISTFLRMCHFVQ